MAKLSASENQAVDRREGARREPAWPLYLKELCEDMNQAANTAARERLRGEIWRVLNSVLIGFLEALAARVRTVQGEDLEGLASEKSLDLLHRIVAGTWEIAVRSPHEIRAYLKMVAKNAVLNLNQRASRRVIPRNEERAEWDVGETGEGQTMSTSYAPDARIERREFSSALRDCAEQLKRRARVAWFLRIFCSLSTKQIAAHPEILLKESHVDVILHRSRQTIRECMQRRGYKPSDMPPGTFSELWQIFEADISIRPEVSHDRS